MLDTDCHFKMPGLEVRGSAALQAMLAAYRAAFPDMRHEVKHHDPTPFMTALGLLPKG